ncbi:MAG: protein kinase, partial [Acidobacteriota bacterium]|nr:protein kinase [Acidobacteriota bacterium]
QMIGSPAYMSPEQIRGEKLDGRSDFFSLGVVFYELLTGSRPFPGDSITALVYQILHTEPLDPLAIRADLPPSTSELFVRLLAKSPERRPADAAEFLREVRRLADQLSEAEQTVDSPGVVAATIPMTIPLARSTVPAPPAPPTADPAGPVTASGAGEPPAAAGAAPRRAGGALFLFGLAAVLVAFALLMTTWRRSKVESESEATPSIRPRSGVVPAPAGVPPPTASAVLAEPGPTLGPLPTPGPPSAADAVVGAPRYTGTRPPKPTPESRAAGPVVGPAEEGSAESVGREGLSGATPDHVYQTRRYAKIGVSPDQARMYVDGRYVGIADDWDDRGGGRKFEFTRAGTHRVRFELPGHRDVNVEVQVSPAASDDTVEIGDELKRESKVPYPKLSSPSERTAGPVVFEVDPPDATIMEGTRLLGPASSFGASSPLKLSGPMVHDLVLSAPGRKPKTVRVLVGPTADNPVARIQVELKKD